MAVASPELPPARGPLSELVLAHLRGRPPCALTVPPAEDDPLNGDDSSLALYLCYELHYRGFAGVPESMEWDPALLAVRAQLEHRFECRLRDAGCTTAHRGDIEEEIARTIDEASGPSLSTYMMESGTLDEFREFAVHRSAYQLKEADPHTWAIPRLFGEAKAALVAIQADEYGYGEVSAVH